MHPRDAAEPFVWETKKLTPYNGSYTFKVWVQTHGAPSAQTAEASQEGVLVDNAPARPAAPKVAGIDGRKVTIRWDAAPEPDVEHYYLYPARTQSPDQTPEFDPDDRIKVDGTEYVHEVPQAGAWWYKIRVVRYSPADADGIWSDPSERSAKPGVVAAPTPSPEPTKDPDGGSGNTSRSRPRRASGPLVSPRPIVRANKPPPVRDAPYTAILPYDLPEDGSASEEGAGPASFGRPEVVADDEGAQTVLPIVAAGLFLVSAALAIGRMPT